MSRPRAATSVATSAITESDKRGRGHGHPHRERERHGPKAPVQLPPPVAHLPAVDGFDFRKPYESVAPADGASATKADAGPPKRPLRPVAALLGGLGKK